MGPLSFLLLVAAVVVAAIGVDKLWVSAKTLAPSGPDQDLDDLFAGPTATAWRHSDACTECYSPVGHREYMTKVCLTCGRRMRWLPRSAAIRQVVRHGRWVRQQLVGDTSLLELKAGVWLTPEEYDEAVAQR